MMKKLWIFATILFTLLIVAIVFAANTGQIPRWLKPLYDFPGGDQVGHFILFGILNFLLIKSALLLLPNRNPIRLVLTISLILSILVGLEEWSQSLIPARTMSMGDLIVSYLGVGLFAILAYRTRK